MDWIFKNQPLTEIPSGKPEGFVYRITNTISGKQYIGKKSFWSSKTIVVKGKKKKTKVESNWRDYYGSNDVLQSDVKELGKESFTREVISIHATKSLVSYYEAKWQFQEDALMQPEKYYNSWIMIRVRSAHIAGKE